MRKKCATISFAIFLVVILLSADSLAAAVSKLKDIRSWQHKGYTRLVLDAEGAQPLTIGPVTAESVIIIFEQLELMRAPSDLFRNLIGAAASVNHHRQTNRSVIIINFVIPDTAVKSFYLPGKSAEKDAYRLIMDLYPPGSVATGPGALVPVASIKAAVPAPAPTSSPAAAPQPRDAAEASKKSLPAAESSQQFEEIIAEAPGTASASPIVRGEIASEEQKQRVPPAESPSKARAKGEKQNLSKTHRSEKVSRVGVTEQSSNLNEFRDGKDKTLAVLEEDVPMAEKPAHIPAAQPPQSGINGHAPGVVQKATSGVATQNDTAPHFKNLADRKKEPHTAGQRKPLGIEARIMSISSGIEENIIQRQAVSHESKGPIYKQKTIGLVELTLKLLSIALSCLVILFLYRTNKIASNRYHALKQIQHRLDTRQRR